jgi:hypothetical protein
MRIKDLIAELENLDPDREIICQVVAKDGKAWNMFFEFAEIPRAKNEWLTVLSVFHPDLKTLPDLTEVKKDDE